MEVVPYSTDVPHAAYKVSHVELRGTFLHQSLRSCPGQLQSGLEIANLN